MSILNIFFNKFQIIQFEWPVSKFAFLFLNLKYIFIINQCNQVINAEIKNNTLSTIFEIK